MAIVIKNATLLTLDSERGDRPIEADISMDRGVIAEIGPDIAPAPGDTVIDGRDRLVIPGLVNAHAHSWEALLKGRYHNLPLELWLLTAYPLLGYQPLSPRLIYLRTMLMGIESLKNGVTCLLDDILELPGQSPDSIGAAFRAYGDLGLRATVAGHIINRPLGEALPFVDDLLTSELKQDLAGLPPPLTAAQYLAFAREVAETYHQRDGRLRFMPSPSGPQRCTEDLLVGAHELAREIGSPFHIHVLESKSQAVGSQLFYGKTLIRYMDDLGILSDRSLLAHSIWVTDDDIGLMAERGCSVVHNPISNQKLGSGIAPFRKLLDAGVNVALGSDGISTSDTPRMLDVIRATALVHCLSTPDYQQWPSISEVLYAATMGGARAARLDHQIGSLQVGKRADMVVFDTTTLNFTPLNDVRKHLVHCENGTSIRMVIVDGEILVEDGKVKTVDEDAIVAELREHMPAFQANHTQLEQLNARLAPILDACYRKCCHHDVGLNRLASPSAEWTWLG